jgi:hypothetical protein
MAMHETKVRDLHRELGVTTWNLYRFLDPEGQLGADRLAAAHRDHCGPTLAVAGNVATRARPLWPQRTCYSGLPLRWGVSTTATAEEELIQNNGGGVRRAKGALWAGSREFQRERL